jgi:uncharacterized protein (DUF2147 family)
MKKLLFTLLLLFPLFSFSQEILGKWKTIDDETGKAKSIVEIFKATNGKIYGRVYKILTVGEENKKCTACKGDLKDKPITGMIILNGLTKDGDEWSGGTIMDPNKGKTYDCYITLESKDKLKVRGYMGVALLGRTQYWYRVTE